MVQKIIWNKQNNGDYYTLYGFDYSNLKYAGVYLIWARSIKSILKVGQSINIAGRISDHKHDERFKRYNETHGPLLITWAKAPLSYLDGIEAYLGDYYQPLFGDRFPVVPKIVVNSPQ